MLFRSALLGSLTGIFTISAGSYAIADISLTAGQLQIGPALKLGALEVVFVFLFVDLFDNIGTLVGVGSNAQLFDESLKIPRLSRIFWCDATATVVGSLSGTSTVVSYIESAAGVAAGGRSGVTAIVTGLFFLVTLAATPFLGSIPSQATAPALILVGSLMASHMSEVRWNDPTIAIPSFLTMLLIPLTYSIATGLSCGFIVYALLRLLQGKARKEDWLVYLLAALFMARFAYLSAG